MILFTLLDLHKTNMNRNCIIMGNDQQKRAKINWTENKYQIADCQTKYGTPSKKLLNPLKIKSIKVLSLNIAY